MISPPTDRLDRVLAVGGQPVDLLLHREKQVHTAAAGACILASVTAPLPLFATAPRGVAAPLAEELRDLGATEVAESVAGVAFSGPLEVAYRACLWSRVANRILLPLARFEAADAEALYAGVLAIPWSDHIAPGRTLAVDCSTARSAIAHSHFAALKTKDAIVDQLRARDGGRPSVDTESPDVRVNLHLSADQATVSIDLAGDSLHQRGYRDAHVEAPLKENLAAAILLLSGWPGRASDGEGLIDPMCGSGSFAIEAALIAADIAPALRRRRFGFSGWAGHDAALWQRLLDEARGRARPRPDGPPSIVASDEDTWAVRAAKANADRAGVGAWVRVEQRPFVACAPEPGCRAGLVVVNPPYGERLGEPTALAPLYEQIGDRLRRAFPGWTGLVLTGRADLAKRIGLRPSRRLPLWNGPIECRLLEYPIAAAAPAQSSEGPRWRVEAREAASAFANRLTKNLRHLRKWARREVVTCFRVYDADLPEYAVAVDLYEDVVQVQEYAPPKTVDPLKAEERLRALLAVLPGALEIPADHVFCKVRRRTRPEQQYERHDDRDEAREVGEGGHRFLVNLTDYLDTGLYLDQRSVRARFGELAAGRDALNLFCYTGTATVYAAAAARSTVSVDLSHTYLAWAERNFTLNRLDERRNQLVRAECVDWLRHAQGRFGAILLAPPTFSNSKAMQGTLDIQRDHVALISDAARLLDPDGVLLFSSHFRRLKVDLAGLAAAGLVAVDISAEMMPPDFERDPRRHQTLRITRR